MPSFEEEFIKTKGGPIKYHDRELIGFGRIPVKKNFSGNLKVISTNSEYRQAIIIQADDRKAKKIIIDGQKERSFIIWADEIKNDVIYFKGTSKNFELFVWNAWEDIAWDDEPYTRYWTQGAAMIEEVNGNTRRYKCNDGHPDENFDDIVFEITIDE